MGALSPGDDGLSPSRHGPRRDSWEWEAQLVALAARIFA